MDLYVNGIRLDTVSEAVPTGVFGLMVWPVDGPGQAGLADPVATLVLGPPRPVGTLIVNGATVVDGGRLRTGDPDEIARDVAAASARLAA